MAQKKTVFSSIEKGVTWEAVDVLKERVATSIKHISLFLYNNNIVYHDGVRQSRVAHSSGDINIIIRHAEGSQGEPSEACFFFLEKPKIPYGTSFPYEKIYYLSKKGDFKRCISRSVTFESGAVIDSITSTNYNWHRKTIETKTTTDGQPIQGGHGDMLPEIMASAYRDFFAGVIDPVLSVMSK